MTKEHLQKITNARDVWLELHRFFDANDDDKTYEIL